MPLHPTVSAGPDTQPDALQDILTESFDPIVELTTGADLMMAMVYAQELGDWDYSGMYTAVLKFKVRPVFSADVIESGAVHPADVRGACAEA